MNERNILGKKLEICSLNPLTGYNRDGKCSIDKFDHGNHLVCAKMDKNFLNFTKSRGNDLSSVVKKGQNWCLCQDRWLQAHKKGKAPKVVKKATNKETRKQVKDIILQQYGGKIETRKKLPKLRKISYKNKKHHYRLKDPFRKRKLAIHEGVNREANKTGKTKKKAAIAKKGRFNILRIYRKNKKIKECNTITHDMRYMDRKYGLGKTKNICGQRGGWSRVDLSNIDSNGEPYYDCPGKSKGDWRYKEGVIITQIDRPPQEAQEIKIEEMEDTGEFTSYPMLVMNHTVNPHEQSFRIGADRMCWGNFKPLKNKAMEGAGRQKKTRKKRGGNDQCAICLQDDLGEDDNTIRLSCGHFFCKNCIRGWLVSSNTCPLCRGVVSQEDRNRVGGLEQYPANLFLQQEIESESDNDDVDWNAEYHDWVNAQNERWFHFANNNRWIKSDAPDNQVRDNIHGGWKENGIYVPAWQSYRGGIDTLIHNPRARENFVMVNYNGNQYRVVGAKVRQYWEPGSSNTPIHDYYDGTFLQGGHIVYEKISRLTKAVGFLRDYETEEDFYEALGIPVTEEDILNDINRSSFHGEVGIDFININDIQEHFNWNKVYTNEERFNIYSRWKRRKKREENREENVRRANENRRRRARNRRRYRCPPNIPNCNIQGGRKRRKKKTRKKQKKQFLYNPNDPSKSFDVYIDKNPNDTIPIKYTTVKDVEDTIKKLERLYKTKKYPHKRIWQVGMIMKVRLEAMNKYKKTRYKKAKKVFQRFQLAKKYFKFLGERTKKKTFLDRKKMTFNYKMARKKTRKKQKGGYRMKEKIMKFKKGPFPKKYTAIVKDIKSKKTRKIHFGDRRYQQYKDRTPLKLYAKNNHKTRKRMQNYFSRHSGTKKRGKAIKKEKRKSRGKYNAKILSHIYLW